MPRKPHPRKRLGRPPDTRSDETHDQLLRAARECFARFGYQKTTNRDIAEAAGLTTGAIYHYYDSKQALFGAVAEEVSEIVMQEFRAAVESETTFEAQFAALLEAAARIHERDPSIASFTVTSPIEIQRHPELLESMTTDNSVQQEFFHDLVQAAMSRGEIPQHLAVEDVENMVLSLTIGLAYYSVLSGSPDVLRSAMRAAEALVSLALTEGAGSST